MVTTEKTSMLLFWLREHGSSNDSYHAYRTRGRGSKTVCGKGPEILDLNKMDSGGSRSKCCPDCFYMLYPLPRLKKVGGNK